MIEAQEQRGFSGMKEAMRSRRFTKKLAHAENIALGGSRGQRLDGILNTADRVLSQLQKEHADWIEQKRMLFRNYLFQVEPSIVEEAYKAGLATTITQEFRTYRRVSKDETIKLDDPEYLKGVITGYTVDFLRSLRLSQRFGIHPNTALDIARLSYRYNPTKLIQLIRQYPDVNLSVLERAALGYPKNPEAFLDGFISTVAKLSADPKYADLNPSVLERAALGYPKNPEAFLDGFISTVAKLSADPKYADLNPSVINSAALRYPKNPEAFLDGFIATVAKLSADPKYADLNPGVINSAALGYPKNPEAFLDGFIATVAKLSADPKYVDLNPGVINLAALGYPKNPEAFLDGFISTVAKLSADPKYVDLNPGVLERAALSYPKNPEAFLDGFIATVARLAEKYPGVLKSTITLAALHFAGNPEAYIEKVKAGKQVPKIEEVEEPKIIVPTEIIDLE